MTETPKIISKSTAWDFACRKRSHLQLLNAMNFSDTSLHTPALNIYHDDVQFFDPANNEIHLGTDGVVDMFKPEDELEFYNGLLYVQGHEEQHRRSTPSEPYARAIDRGAENVIRYIAKMEGDGKKSFRSKRQYEDYIILELPKRGVYFNLDAIKQIMGYIANSLEDGRIERIRASRLPGFAKLRVYFRGKFWEGMDKAQEPWDDIKSNPVKKIQLLTRELLSLATCQLYSIGFVTAYANTPILTDVNKMMPYIASAIMSGSVRKLEPSVIGISNIFAPYIYEALRMTEEEMEEENRALEEFLKELIDAMIENSMDTNLGEFQEDTDDGGFESVFEHTDITIMLDDETYDKLMEKKEKESSGGGIMIKREHPKEDEDNPDNDDSKSGGSKNDAKDNSDGKTGSSGEEKPDEKKEGSSETGHGAGKPEDKNDDIKNSGENATKSGQSDEESSSNADHDDKEREEPTDTGVKINPDKEWKSRKGKANHKGKISDGTSSDREKAIKSVHDAIRNAAKITKASAEDKVGRINEHAGHMKKNPERIVKDTDPVITDCEMKDVLNGSGFSFVEVKRTYTVDRPMDSIIEARGKALHRKIEKYFRSLKTPNIRNLDSGGIDPSRIYGLAIGDTDVFRKPGKSKYFDGCAYILMDNSGSMWGPKFDEACKAAAVIEEGFRGIFPIKIVAFDDNFSSVIHRVIKGWDESLRENCAWNFHEYSHPGAGNADGCSIAIATKELQRRPEKKKLLVVLSDGAPTEGGPDPVQLTKDAIKNARKKRITVTGIYFEVGEIDPHGAARVFRECYQKDYICCPLSELDGNLVKTFEKFARS